jgi:hypothetical protein
MLKRKKNTTLRMMRLIISNSLKIMRSRIKRRKWSLQ